MAIGQTSYSDWARQNQGLVDQAMQRVAPPPAAAPAPAPAPQPSAQPAQPAPTAPVTVQVTTAAPAQPAQAPAQPAAAPPPVAPVAPPARGNTQQQLENVQADQITTQNAIGESQQRQGEAEVGAATRNAAELDKAAEARKPLIEAAQRSVAENDAQSDEYRRIERELIDTYRKPIIDDRSALQKAGGVLAGIVSAMFKGRGIIGNALSYGMDAVTDHVNRTIQDQLEAKDAAGKALPHVRSAMDSLAQNSRDQPEIASKLAANQFLIAEDQLKKIAEETKVPEIRENAFRLAEASHGRANDLLRPILEQRLAEEKAARAAKAKGKLASMEDWELRKIGTPEAMKILKARYDTDEQAANVMDKQANTAKTLGEAQKAAEGTKAPVGADDVVENDALYSSTSDTEKAEYRAKKRDTADLKSSVEHIRKLLKRYGTESTGRNAEILKTYTGTLMGQYNRGAKFGAMDNGTMGLLQDVIGDPNALLTGGETALAKLAAVERSADDSLNNHRSSIGIQSQSPEAQLARTKQAGARQDTPAAPQEAPAVAGPPPAQATVTMVLPITGQRVPVPANRPDLIERMRETKGAVTEEEYQDAEREQQYQAEAAQNQLAYQEGR